MKKSFKIIVSFIALFISSLVYGQLFDGVDTIIQNGKVVGEIYVPKWDSPTEYREYFALATDYSYFQKATWEKQAKPNYFADKETFRKAMAKKYPFGKWIETHCKEEAL